MPVEVFATPKAKEKLVPHLEIQKKIKPNVQYQFEKKNNNFYWCYMFIL